MYIYAPYIGDTVPAFTNLSDLRIPFTPHPGVQTSVAQPIAVRILPTTPSTQPIAHEIGAVEEYDGQYYVVFSGKTTIPCTPNVYYKFQIAYCDAETPIQDLYYSSVAIGKCIEAPTITVLSNNTEVQNFDISSCYDPEYWTDIAFATTTYTLDVPVGQYLLVLNNNNNIQLDRQWIYLYIYHSDGTRTTAGTFVFEYTWQNTAIPFTIGEGDTVKLWRYCDSTQPISAVISAAYLYDTINHTIDIVYTPSTRSEGLYQYRLILQNANLALYDTGWMMNTSLSNHVAYYYSGELDTNQYYTLTVKTMSLNGYETSVTYDHLVAADALESSTNNSIEVSYNKEDACATIVFAATVVDEDTNDNEGLTTSRFYEILRREAGAIEWEVLTACALEWPVDSETGAQSVTFVDNSLAYGINYEYGCRQYDPITQNRSSIQQASDGLETYFEHMYISDGDKQLCIKYNPKVSSFKETILEQKMDTIGGKYPFFFRNGQVGYKEIPISGLISYLMDESQMFMSDTELGLIGEYAITGSNEATSSASVSADKIRTINLVDYNIAAERKFKLAVLEWLTNGQPKLFRSPTEGNYIIRLMNVSLSPEDQLGRMLHTFTATGYECMACTLDNLRDNNLLLARPIALSSDSVAIADSTFGYGRDMLGGFVLNYNNSTLGGIN